MIYNKIVTNDNQTITSENLMNLTVTWETNSETNIKPGSCVSTMVSGEVVGDYTDWEDVTNFTLYSTHDSDLTNATWTKVGVFYVQNTKPTGKNRFSIEAYDAISKLEVNVANFVYNNWVIGWASSTKTVFQLVSAICTQCGITAEPITSSYHFPTVNNVNTDTLIISIEGLSRYDDWTTATITGRQIISWLAELCGCFVVINPEDNKLQFSWYDTDNLSWQRTKYANVYDSGGTAIFQNVCDVITPSSEETYLFGSTSKKGKSYKQGSLTFDRYTVDNDDFYAVVDKDDGTIGYYYPTSGAPGDDTPKYMISDNRFICSLAVNNSSTESSKITNLALLVRRVQEAVAYANYKPFSATLFPVSVDAGDVFRGFCGFPVGVIDYSGNKFRTIITKCVRSVNGLTISSTGEEDGGVYQTSNSSTQGNNTGKVVTIPVLLGDESQYPDEYLEYQMDAQTAFQTIESAIKSNCQVVAKMIELQEETSGSYKGFNYYYAPINIAYIHRFGSTLSSIDADIWFVCCVEGGLSYTKKLTVSDSSSGTVYSWESDDYRPAFFNRGSGEPSSSIKAVEGDFYTNTANGDIYHCTNVTGSVSTWEKIQGALVSGTTIKTVNGQSVLGSGNIAAIPTGGTAGQVLSKVDGTDYNVEWTNGGGGGTSNFNELTNRPSYNGTTMTGGTSIPEVKTSTWDAKQDALVSGTSIKTVNGTSLLGSGNIPAIPTGGTAGQILSKVDGTDYNAEWVNASQASHGIPSGGTAGQVLAKVDSTDYNTGWVNQSGSSIPEIIVASSQVSSSEIQFTSAQATILEDPDNGVFVIDFSDTNTGFGRSAFIRTDIGEFEEDAYSFWTIFDASSSAHLICWFKYDKSTDIGALDAFFFADGSTLADHIEDDDIHVTAAQKTTWTGKQDALVSGTNIKTINSQSLLGSGDISISASLSYPLITVASSQVTYHAAATVIQFTNEQATIIENSDNAVIVIDLLSIDYSRLVFERNLETDVSTGTINLIAKESYKLNIQLRYTRENKSAILTEFFVADEDDLTGHTEDEDIHVTTANKTTWNNKQDALVSGTNIKSVNGVSILGSGNIPAIPTGGTTGQVLAKTDGTDYNVQWVTSSPGSSDFNDLSNRPSYNGSTMTGSTSIPEVKTATWDAKQDSSNRVTSWSATPLDTNYPSEKLVYDTIGDVSDLLDALLNGVS